MLQHSDVAGPIFISLGKHEKLQKFLELNPKINGEFAFVDESPTFEAYNAVGFGKILDENFNPNLSSMKVPGLNTSQWIEYAKNVVGLSPVDLENIKAEVPEGTARLGGTFVIDGDEVLYAWSDSVPWDTPSVEDVLARADICTY
mmetsp:Transcript_45592/g.87184  ORF Transcript_45592/g.87184 Transcript_45592/m.87184 type:complete len:145 (+) Transcript_45592:459-893(+)